MPPKAKPGGPSKKTVEKKKEKVIEDKTFGLKNKKGAKQQRFIDQVQKQVKSGGPNPTPDGNLKKLEKEKKLKEQLEINMLFRPVATQKVPKGTDPKSVLCAFFKQGQCTKGDRCKFSHDLTIERKAEKRSLYCDLRDDEGDTMENWDEAKLKEVVQQKHGDTESKRSTTTDIICKFFLEAVENSKYGWFWSCPNGTSCIYKHALPPGFVLKKDRKKELEKKDDLSLEDLIERERAALGSNFTKVTLETFIAWKKRKLKEKKDLAVKDEEKKRFDYKAGRQMGISGREMFFFNPDLAAADQFEEGDEAFDSYNLNEEEEHEIKYREIQLDFLHLEAQEVDGTGTQATEDRLKDKVDHSATNGNASTPESVSEGAAAVPINENLFVDDDLDDLDEEFDDLDLDH